MRKTPKTVFLLEWVFKSLKSHVKMIYICYQKNTFFIREFQNKTIKKILSNIRFETKVGTCL